MRGIIFILALSFISILGYGQIFNEFGHQPVNEFDTVKVVILITNCDNCGAQSVEAYAIRQKNVYFGDRMPPMTYEDYWSILSYLNSQKKPFAESVIIWNSIKK